MKTGGYAGIVGRSDLYVRPLSSDEVMVNLGLIVDAGLVQYVDLAAMGVKMKRYTPRVKDDWAWADRV